MILPDVVSAKERVLSVALKVKELRERGIFECKKGVAGCFACTPFEKILRGEAELVKTDEERKTELYMV